MFGGSYFELIDINPVNLKMKKGKVGTSGREIQHQLYGTRGRPLNPVEANAAESNAHLAYCGKLQRGELDRPVRYTPVSAPVERPQPPVKDKTKRANKWAAARRAQGLREDGSKA